MTTEEFTLSSGKRRLDARTFYPTRKGSGHCAVLFIHGKRSDQQGYESRAQSVSRSLNAVCLTFDLSGHGRDAVDFSCYTVPDHLQDVVAAYDHLASLDSVDPAKIGVCGASYGGYLAALLTGRRDIKRLALRAPALAHGISYQNNLQGGSSGDIPEGFDSLKLLAQYNGDVLIIESENDEVVPSLHLAAYLRASTHTTHEIIRGATHALTDPAWDAAFVKLIISWFQCL